MLLATFAYGLVQLFNLRFAGGDVYPPYSSLRGDPLGCKVYFESLEQLGNNRVGRHKQSIEKLPERGTSALFVFGLPWSEMTAQPEEFQALETFVRGGGRLVVTLYPELNKPRGFISGAGTNRPVFKNPLRDYGSLPPPINLRERWGFGMEHIPTTREGRLFSPVTAARIQPEPLPAKVSWHSSLVFTNLDFSWRVIYARGTDPVMIEKQHGAGSIVLATDSYFVSNEAMRKERDPDLLTWLPGSSREIIFDETHFGVMESAGVAILARRYKLHGGVIALLVLAVLFIWKNSVSFVPRLDEQKLSAPVLGRESAAGFQNLLQRSIDLKDLLQASLDEWHKAGQLDRRHSASRRERIRAVVEAYNDAEKPNIVDAYREITRILNHKK
jgi:hypothetical protein